MGLKELSSVKLHGGMLKRFAHTSIATQCEMTFAIYLPPDATRSQNYPALFWLSGLTCTDENFCQKSGAFKRAATLGLVIVAPDTSPRGKDVPDDENQSYDFGLGAGFYIDATCKPWSKHYNMESYIVDELLELVDNNFNTNGKWSIAGHSMGGHGALTLSLKYPDTFHSVSAFSPISHPSACPWGIKAFTLFLGEDKSEWEKHDAVELIKNIENATDVPPILVDQGLDDEFLSEQLNIDALEQGVKDKQLVASIHKHEGYDHSYFFITSFIDSHLDFHIQHLRDDS